jgi:hypothetical protein
MTKKVIPLEVGKRKAAQLPNFVTEQVDGVRRRFSRKTVSPHTSKGEVKLAWEHFTKAVVLLMPPNKKVVQPPTKKGKK